MEYLMYGYQIFESGKKVYNTFKSRKGNKKPKAKPAYANYPPGQPQRAAPFQPQMIAQNPFAYPRAPQYPQQNPQYVPQRRIGGIRGFGFTPYR